MTQGAFLSAVSGFCFGLYPIVLNRARLDPMLTVVLYLAGTLLIVSPLAVWLIARGALGMHAEPQTAAILEVAMPTMLMASSFADRFHLDARAAALNIVPSSTGAAKAVGLVIPALQGNKEARAR